MVNFNILKYGCLALAGVWLGCTPAGHTAAAVKTGSRGGYALTLPVTVSGSLELAQLRPSPPAGQNRTGWTLVRTPGPDKAGDTISIMRTADLLNSDPDLAGIMIRCQDKGALQIAFVVVTPFKPRSKVNVTLRADQSQVSFDGAVIGPGSMVALPAEASALLRNWQTAKDVRVEIDGEEAAVRGVVPLDGLAEAVTQLETNCMR